MVQKKDLEEKSQDPGTVERRLWHGTSKDGVGGINHYGFNRSYCGANGWFFDNFSYDESFLNPRGLIIVLLKLGLTLYKVI